MRMAGRKGGSLGIWFWFWAVSGRFYCLNEIFGVYIYELFIILDKN